MKCLHAQERSQVVASYSVKHHAQGHCALQKWTALHRVAAGQVFLQLWRLTCRSSGSTSTCPVAVGLSRCVSHPARSSSSESSTRSLKDISASEVLCSGESLGAGWGGVIMSPTSLPHGSDNSSSPCSRSCCHCLPALVRIVKMPQHRWQMARRGERRSRVVRVTDRVTDHLKPICHYLVLSLTFCYPVVAHFASYGSPMEPVLHAASKPYFTLWVSQGYL